MNKLIGITIPVTNFFKPYGSEWYADMLKHQYMLADMICIPDLDLARTLKEKGVLDNVFEDESQYYDLPSEIDFLEEKGVICKPPYEYSKEKEEVIDSYFGHQRYIVNEWINSAKKRLTPMEYLYENVEIMKALTNIEVNEAIVRLSDNTKSSIIPFINTESKSEVPILKFKDVLNVVLTKFPIPSPLMPWDDLISFRNEEESKTRNLTLRRWMRKITKDNITQNELEEEIEWLINDYTNYMRIQKVKYNWASLETLIKIPLEVIENVIKINWSKIADPLFNIRSHRIKVIESELIAPSREISYIIEAKKRVV